MGIRVRWENDSHTMIMVHYEQTWTWTDFADAKVEIDRLLNSVTHMVDIVSDSSQSGGLPSGNALAVLASSFQTAPHNIRQVVVVGANPFFKALLQILQTISLNRAAGNIRFVRCIDDVERILRRPALNV